MTGSLSYPIGTESIVGQQRSPLQIDARFTYILAAVNSLIGAGNYSFPDVASTGTTNKALLSNGSGGTSWGNVLRTDALLALTGAASLAIGDILYFDGTNLTRLPAGTSGQLLKTNGAGAPSWATSIPLTDGNKTDVTVSGGGTTWTINSASVSTAKLIDANVTTAKLADASVTQNKLAFNFATKITTYTAANRDWLLCDTSGGAWTLTFPASASTGDMIQIIDLKNTFSTKNLTINPNGLKIESQTGNLVIDWPGFTGTYYYVDATTGWKRIG